LRHIHDAYDRYKHINCALSSVAYTLVCPAAVLLFAGKVAVNFHPELRVLIAEAHYLDRKGFTIPPLALQVALQQGEYRAWTENLERLLQLFYSVGHLGTCATTAPGTPQVAPKMCQAPCAHTTVNLQQVKWQQPQAVAWDALIWRL
jgi:hypothetical protein